LSRPVHMPAPSLDHEPSQSSSGYEDGLGRRLLAFDRETGGMLERLVLRPELCVFEQALLERLGIVAALEDERFATPRTIERDADDRLVVVSEYVGGRRLSDIIEAAADHGIVAGLDAGLGLLLELLPAIARLHDAGLVHGALAPGRVMISGAGQVVLLDAIYGDPLERLQLTRKRLWTEFRLAFPQTAGPARFDKAADLGHAAVLAATLTAGRVLSDDDYPDGIPLLRQDILEIASIRGSKTFAQGVDRFFASTLPLAAKRGAASADEAVIDFRKLIRKELGINACRTALLDFLLQVETADAERVAAQAADVESGRATVQESEGRDRERADAERKKREKAEAERRAEAERQERERLEEEARERERADAERRKREKREAEQRAEAERKERARLEEQERERLERLQEEQREQERAAAERKKREKREAEERAEAERKERERLEEEERERLEAERRERERADAERKKREKREAEERAEAERKERERLEEEERERLEAERRELERAEAERKKREKREAEQRAEAERKERERLEEEARERERAEAERKKREKREAEKRAEAERKERERLEEEERERLEAERRERERAEAERKKREKREAEQRAEAERKERERLAEEARERERAEAERKKREKREAEQRAEAERKERERLEEEARERERAEAERKKRETREAEQRAEAERKERERLEQEARQAAETKPKDPQPSTWLIPPGRSASFEPAVHDDAPVVPRAYPVYKPPVEPAAWAAPPTPVEPVATPGLASIHLAPPATPGRIQLAGAQPSAPIRVKGAAEPVAPSRAESRREPVGLDLSAADAYEPFHTPRERQPIPWKLIAAGVVLIGGVFAISRGYAPAAAPVVETVRKVIPKPVAAPPVPPVASNRGRLAITTQVPGAKVLLDGKRVGDTPVTIDDVAPGRHVVSLSSPEGSAKRTIRIEAGQTFTLDVPLYSGFVAVSIPFVVQVAEGGKVLGTSENQILLAPGHHRLSLGNKDLGYAETVEVDVQPGEAERVERDPRGRANINAAPWAEVWIDGRRIGETPIGNLPIAIGPHEVVFKHPQLGEKKQAVSVTLNAAVRLSMDMK